MLHIFISAFLNISELIRILEMTLRVRKIDKQKE